MTGTALCPTGCQKYIEQLLEDHLRERHYGHALRRITPEAASSQCSLPSTMGQYTYRCKINNQKLSPFYQICLLQPFPLFGVGPSSFQYPRSPVLCFFYLYLFLLHVFSYNITPTQFRSSYLSVSTHFHLPCSHYYIFFSLSRHMA